jgi:beta-phosphoglucomutase family hydrolase
VLGLPDHVTACLFDLDGVLTDTARVHAAAWTGTFDDFLRDWATLRGEPYVPFDPGNDYNSYVDGRPRLDGVRTFLASRAIVLPEGGVDDPPTAHTIAGLANRKNQMVLARLASDGVHVYPGSVTYLQAVRAAGLHRAVVTASANCDAVLAAAGLTDLLEVRIDGNVAARDGLRGKPYPDTFLAAARALGVAPEHAAVFEDAVAGVTAGHAGGFGYVVGVDRVGHAGALSGGGATVVVSDLADLLPSGGGTA